jgi:hypothetical protein
MNIFSSYEAWINVPISQEHRAALIDKGSEYGKANYEKWVQQNIINIKNDDNADNADNAEDVDDNGDDNRSDNNLVLASDPDSLAPNNEEL